MASRLRLARDERGWSQARLISELQKRARAADVSVMASVSLRTALSRWENGHVVPDQHYRRLFREVYALTDDQLGFAANATHNEQRVIDTDQELRSHIANATHVDTAVVNLLQAQTDNLRRLDRRLGAPVLLDQMRAHIATLRQLLEHAVLDRARGPIASALADAAALAGWQALDMGSMTQAWNHYEVARNAALTASDAAALAHAKAEQAYVLLDLGQPLEALQLVREARLEAGRKVAPRLVSWLWAAEAETAAAAGDDGGCRQALDHATSRDSARPPLSAKVPGVQRSATSVCDVAGPSFERVDGKPGVRYGSNRRGGEPKA